MKKITEREQVHALKKLRCFGRIGKCICVVALLIGFLLTTYGIITEYRSHGVPWTNTSRILEQTDNGVVQCGSSSITRVGETLLSFSRSGVLLLGIFLIYRTFSCFTGGDVLSRVCCRRIFLIGLWGVLFSLYPHIKIYSDVDVTVTEQKVAHIKMHDHREVLYKVSESGILNGLFVMSLSWAILLGAAAREDQEFTI